jgi:hypothetical protein
LIGSYLQANVPSILGHAQENDPPFTTIQIPFEIGLNGMADLSPTSANKDLPSASVSFAKGSFIKRFSKAALLANGAANLSKLTRSPLRTQLINESSCLDQVSFMFDDKQEEVSINRLAIERIHTSRTSIFTPISIESIENPPRF